MVEIMMAVVIVEVDDDDRRLFTSLVSGFLFAFCILRAIRNVSHEAHPIASPPIPCMNFSPSAPFSCEDKKREQKKQLKSQLPIAAVHSLPSSYFCFLPFALSILGLGALF